MTQVFRVLFGALCLLFPVSIIPQAPTVPAPSLVMSGVEDFQAAFAKVPCQNAERLDAVATLFREMGATESDYTIKKFKDIENFVLRKPGETEEKIVIGAHYDLAGQGSCGALDNWTGVVTIAHLYRTLKDLKLKKTLVFVGFGQEEKGLLGSKAMTKQIKKDEAKQYCAMVNIDSLGLTTPMVMTNVSSNKLTKLTTELAKKLEMPFKTINLHNANTDSSSFLDKNIPAVSIVAMTQNWMDIFHHREDQAAKVKPESVYLGYRLALSLIMRLDEEGCGAYR